MRTLAVILIAGALLAPAHAETQAIAQCDVHVDNPTDPTLNARTRPKGPILSVFGNREIVNTYDRQGDWIYVEGAISDDNGNIDKHGWVHGAYLRNCRPAAG